MNDGSSAPSPEREPGQLSARGVRIRDRIHNRLIAEGRWDVGRWPLLNILAHACDEHLRLREEMRALDPATAITFREQAEEARLLARLMLAEFQLIPRERIQTAILDDTGDDALIVDLARAAVS